MHVADKVYSLLQYVMTADVRALPPYRRRLLAAQCKRVVAIAERIETEDAKTKPGTERPDGSTGVLPSLARGDRAP